MQRSEAPTPAEPVADAGTPVNAAQALARGSIEGAQRLMGPDGALLVIDPERDAYYFESAALKPLEVLLQQVADQWQPVYSKALAEAREAGDPQPLPRLRWYAGLVATPGILDPRLDRRARYELARWPQTEREFPRHFRIARAMFNRSATPDEIALESGVPYEEVVDFVNACHAAGRLVDASADASAASPAMRLGALLKKPLFTR